MAMMGNVIEGDGRTDGRQRIHEGGSLTWPPCWEEVPPRTPIPFPLLLYLMCLSDYPFHSTMTSGRK